MIIPLVVFAAAAAATTAGKLMIMMMTMVMRGKMRNSVLYSGPVSVSESGRSMDKLPYVNSKARKCFLLILDCDDKSRNYLLVNINNRFVAFYTTNNRN